MVLRRLRKVWKAYSSQSGRSAAAPRRMRSPLLTIEPLEDRCLLAAGILDQAIPGLGAPAVAIGAPAMVGAGWSDVSTRSADSQTTLTPPTRFASEAEFRSYVVDKAIAANSWQFGRVMPAPKTMYTQQLGDNSVGLGMAFANAAFQASTTFNGATSYTQTNNQVQGVDEGDLVETDGQHIYVLSGQNLVILNAFPGTELAQVSKTSLGATPLAMFLDGNNLALISSYGGSSSGVKVTVFDVSDRASPAMLQETSLDGLTYVSSRSIGSQLYVVLSSYLTTPAPQRLEAGDGSYVYETEDQFRARIFAEPLDQLLPSYQTTWNTPAGTAQLSGLVEAPEDIYRPALPGDSRLLSIVRFSENGQQAGPLTSLGLFGTSSTTVYASTKNAYVVTARGYGTGQTSEIDKVNLAVNDLELTAVGSVPGYAVNQFAIDESGAYLRIATSLSWTGPNNLYVLNQDNGLLQVVGKVENFAPGERIYSVRFMGDTAYVVTFVQHDPLFTIDLSVPTNPHIVGELIMPGFSLYLQMVGQTYLLGFGHDTDANGSTQGLELSLFDVSDLTIRQGFNIFLSARPAASPAGCPRPPRLTIMRSCSIRAREA